MIDFTQLIGPTLIADIDPDGERNDWCVPPRQPDGTGMLFNEGVKVRVAAFPQGGGENELRLITRGADCMQSVELTREELMAVGLACLRVASAVGRK